MNEASYISLLDMQRVMQRVLKRSGLPVWHTLGFNPHIYMTFACPLSLGQESQCECVDVKTEAENPDFAQWQTALNAIMPAGIEVYRDDAAFAAASTTWLTSTEVVTVPTPPGTGVMASTTGSASPKRTSPQSLPSSLTWMPTSTTT